MYTLLLYHHRNPQVSRAKFQSHWRQDRFPLILGLQDKLGFQRYSQIHQLPPYHFLYQGLRLSRQPWVMNWVGRLTKQTPSHFVQKSPRNAQSLTTWNGVDRFLYSSKEALIQAVTALSGQEAAQRLQQDAAPYIQQSIAIATEEFVVASAPSSPSPRLVNFYSFRGIPSKSRDEVLHYWQIEHLPLVLGLQSKLKYQAYEQLHMRDSPELQPVVQSFGAELDDPYDGVASLAYGTEGDLLQAFFSIRTQCANIKLIQDELTFLDGGRSSLLLGYEYTQDVKSP